MNKINYVITILLIVSGIASAETSFVDDAKRAMQDTGSAIDKAAQKIGNDVGSYVSDAAITAQIKTKLASEDDIPSTKISINTSNGIVSVKGAVDTDLQVDKIKEIINSVKGVRSIDDTDLNIISSKNYFSDAIITTKVKADLVRLSSDDKINSSYDLHVETTNGIVHLFGTVANSSDLKAIIDSIKKIDGVRAVNTNISTN